MPKLWSISSSFYPLLYQLAQWVQLKNEGGTARPSIITKNRLCAGKDPRIGLCLCTVMFESDVWTTNWFKTNTGGLTDLRQHFCGLQWTLPIRPAHRTCCTTEARVYTRRHSKENVCTPMQCLRAFPLACTRTLISWVCAQTQSDRCCWRKGIVIA